MPFTNIFDTEVVDNEAEEDRTPFVPPEARGGGALVVTMFRRVFSRSLLAIIPDWGRRLTPRLISK